VGSYRATSGWGERRDTSDARFGQLILTSVPFAIPAEGLAAVWAAKLEHDPTRRGIAGRSRRYIARSAAAVRC